MELPVPFCVADTVNVHVPVCSAIPVCLVDKHHVCLPLFFGKSLLHQPPAEHVRAVGVQSEGDGDDDFKRVHIGVQTVFKPHVAAHLVVVQHVRLADGFDGGVHCRDTCVEQSGDFGGGHPYLVTGYADLLLLYGNDSSFHSFSVLNVTSGKFLNGVQLGGKVLHVPVEFLLGYLRINLGCFYALVP